MSTTEIDQLTKEIAKREEWQTGRRDAIAKIEAFISEEDREIANLKARRDLLAAIAEAEPTPEATRPKLSVVS